MFEVIIYVYSVSSIDIKCVLVNLFKEISSILYKDQIYFKIFSDKIITFIVDHVFTDNLLSNEYKNKIGIYKVNLSRNSLSDNHVTVQENAINRKKNLTLDSK
jgi:hypothetical protein